LDAIDRFFPEWFAEPDPEFFDVKSTPACREKMPELMHDDEQIEKNKDLEDNEDDATKMKNHCLLTDYFFSMVAVACSRAH
jgi:hypothetical protein